MTDPDNSWGDAGQKSGVDAHVNAGKVYDFLKNTFSLNSYDKNGSGMRSIVESIECTNNASWNGELLRVRYCVGTPFSSALDVVGHEWGHAVSEKASDRSSSLGSSGEAGALNEAFSDWMGTALEHGNGEYNWTIGEGAEIIRNLADPRQTNQPDIYGGADWSPNNSAHKNSGVPNKMFYLLSDPGTRTFNNVTVTGIGIDKAIKIAYKANMEKWGAGLIFRDARAGMIAAAVELGCTSSEVDQVKNAWAAVGVTETSTPQLLETKRTLPSILQLLLLN
jgi:Zn-dependent metalloprotease